MGRKSHTWAPLISPKNIVKIKILPLGGTTVLYNALSSTTAFNFDIFFNNIILRMKMVDQVSKGEWLLMFFPRNELIR